MEGDVRKSSVPSTLPSAYVNESRKSENAVVPVDGHKKDKPPNSHASANGDCVHEHLPHQSPFSFRGRYFDSPNRDINVASPWFLCNRPQSSGFSCPIHADGPPSFMPGVVNQFNNKPFMMPQQLFADEAPSPYPAHIIYTPPYTFPPPTMAWPPRPPQYAFPQPRFNSIYTSQPIAVPNVTAFQPIRTRCYAPVARNLSPPNNLVTFNAPNAVELVVSNLDYNISAKEWRKILFTTFHPQVQVLNVFVKTQPDNTSIAMMKVPSIEDARFAISQFHRKKIGYKRIHVTLKSDDSPYLASSTRTEVVALLSEVHGGVLPLFKFIELFDKRYHRPISVSELYKMKDIIEISEQGGAGRMIYLRGSNAPSSDASTEPEVGLDVLEVPVCQKHCENTSTLNYIMALNCSMLPIVWVELKTLAPRVHSLLQDHEGSMHLMSFTACYEAKFTVLEPSEVGVPLEHLISCVPGVQIKATRFGIKKVQWTENKQLDSPGSASSQGSTSPLLTQQMSQICRELVDLLKHSPNTRMPFTKFIPAYHHHFGRQCRVADYGYTRLQELFEAIPHVLQIMGVGDRKVLTLTHKAQVRRFTSDLLRVLKSYPSKEMSLSVLNEVFEKVHGKALEITDYGVCSIADLLSDVSSQSITVTEEGDETMLSIPKKDQSFEESERTRQFGLETIDLLKHNPQCRMPFNKFIPAYHHHFGRQCRVADYGFTKLLELFECLPHIVKQVDDGDERIIGLTEPELRKVMAEQIVRLLQIQPSQRVPLTDFHQKFSSHYGFTILLDDFGVESIPQLLATFKHIVRIEAVNGEPYVVLLGRGGMPILAHHILLLLMNQSGGSLPLVELCSRYRSMFDAECDVARIRDELMDYVQISGDDQSGVISLTHLQSFARDIRNLLLAHSAQLPFHRVELEYLQKFGVEIKPSLYGHSSLQSLLAAIPHIVAVTGSGIKRMLQLSPEFQNSSMSASPMSPIIYPHDHNFNDVATATNDPYPSLHDTYHSTNYGKASDSSGFVSGLPSFDLSGPRQYNTSPEVLEKQARDATRLPSPKDLLWMESPEDLSSDDGISAPTSEQLHQAAQCLPHQSDYSMQRLPLQRDLTTQCLLHQSNLGPRCLPNQSHLAMQHNDLALQGPHSQIDVKHGSVAITNADVKKNATKPKPASSGNPKGETDAFINKFTGGWWKASTEQLQNLPIIKSHIEKMKSGDEKIAEDVPPTGNVGHRSFQKPTSAFQKSGCQRGVFGERPRFANENEGVFVMETGDSIHETSRCDENEEKIGWIPNKLLAFHEKAGDFQAKRSVYHKTTEQDKHVTASSGDAVRENKQDTCRLPHLGSSRNSSPSAKTDPFGSPGLCHISKILDFNVNEIKLDRSYELRSKLRKPTRSDATSSIVNSMMLEGTSANNSFLDDLPNDTSSVKSDDCNLAFKLTAQSPPKKTRIAANFAAPYQISWNY